MQIIYFGKDCRIDWIPRFNLDHTHIIDFYFLYWRFGFIKKWWIK